MNSELKATLRRNRDALVASDKSLRAIFDIMFSARDSILCEGNDGFRTYRHTYGEIGERVRRAAAGLYEKIGATHGYVALEMENSADWIVAFWAILMSGNKPYLVNTRYPASLTEAILSTLKVDYIVCADGSDLNGTALPLASLTGEGDLPADIFEDELAFSSSATSMNEVVCFYSGAQIAAQILNFENIVKANPRIAKHYKGSLKQLAFLPFYHVFGLFAVYFWFTFFGCTLVFLRDYSADTILKTVRRHEVTHIFAVPMLWHTVEKQVLAAVADGGDKLQKKFDKGIRTMTALQNVFPSLGAAVAKRAMAQVTDKLFGRSVMFCISGGSYLRDSALSLLNGLGYCLHNGFGMSEVGITSVELRRRPKERNENAIGRPFDSAEYRLGEDGGLFIRGSSLCRKKLVNGEEQLIDGWFETGDIAEERDGNYFLLGRRGDMVIGENGENINPDGVEKVFSRCAATALSVLGLPADGDEVLSMVVQVSAFASPTRLAALRDEIYAINATLPLSGQVKKFYFTLDELVPPTAIKVSRAQLRRKLDSGEVTLVPFGEFGTATQDMAASPLFLAVREVVAEVLHIASDTIEPSTHVFYDLGATSIQYFTMLSQLAEKFSITDYNKNDTYRYTLKDMCDYIERFL